MIDKTEIPYWIALAHIPKWGNEKINKLIIKINSDEKIRIKEFFNLSENDLIKKFYLNDKDILDLQKAKNDLPNYSFLAEDLLEQGYEVLPITSFEYPKTLKENLNNHSPPLIYFKGNKQILQENSVAIVGSREASEIALKFTENIARQVSKENKVVVSGFAKGVDKQALNSAIEHNGRSIIVLPQGIMTFAYGFNKYYKQIVDGNILVMSTFFPKAPWSVQLAMARNPIIYGLAKEIFVAESNEKGGTWAGVIDGLRKKRKIYIRMPEPSEKKANKLLIERGAIPVDLSGLIIPNVDLDKKPKTFNNLESFQEIADSNRELKLSHIYKEPEIEPSIVKESNETIEGRILNALKSGELTSKEIIRITKLDWKPPKLIKFLKDINEIEVLNKKPLKFRLKNDPHQTRLFT
ncbi:MAG: DNA-protecting protein DprA [Candidatus Methanoperedenaceae archaeon]|nr:DNA-protecting protein DprA [Candidatus Methanoperedenaceae archaeon]